MKSNKTVRPEAKFRRSDGRKRGGLRPVILHPGYLEFAEGSCLIEVGKTRVLCSASASDGVPLFREGTGQGWVTAEYGMLPNSTPTRVPRERARGGRSQEIQRLIGRSLRGVTDLEALGERTIIVDCDVIQADGGTRTASITGAVVALYELLLALEQNGELPAWPLRELVAAVSVGLGPSGPLLDLNYAEDHAAWADFNLVMTESGRFIEFQGTAESGAFDENQISQVIDLGWKGIQQLVKVQRSALDDKGRRLRKYKST